MYGFSLHMNQRELSKALTAIFGRKYGATEASRAHAAGLAEALVPG
jgi:hypothetical protein